LRFLFVSIEALSIDLAWQLVKEGHEVKFYTQSQSEQDVGDGFVPKAQNWEEQKDWADVIIFDDVGFGTTVEKLKLEGKAVIGGTPYTDKLELDREFGQEELSKVGVKVLPRWNFTNFDEAINFVSKNPQRFVLKPSGRVQNEKELLFVGQEEDGKDIAQVLEHYKKHWSSKIKVFQLQKFARGVEVAVGAFFNGSEFIDPINVNFEHKRMFPGEIGPSTGELGTHMYWTKPNAIFHNTLGKMKEKLAETKYVGYIDINCIANESGIYPLEWTCFDEETEILTKKGWRKYSEVEVGNEALAIDPPTRTLKWKRITSKIVKEYEGEMIRFGAKDKSHSALSALVTPDHSMLVCFSGNPKLVRADSIPIDETKIIRTGKFEGETVTSFEIRGFVEQQHYSGRRYPLIETVHASMIVEATAFMSFIGLYLSNGFVGGHNYTIILEQSQSSQKRREIEEILNQTGLKYTIQRDGKYQISSPQLVKYLESLGLVSVNAYTKFIPTCFKNLSPNLLESLLRGFWLGDVNLHHRLGRETLTTVSPKLADDLQEIIIKCGGLANIRVQTAKDTISNEGCVGKNHMYVLSIEKRNKDYNLGKGTISKEKYKGKVWDVEVEDLHTMLVRRNGKPFFSGNCRFGYPTISIQMEGVTSDWGTLLSDIAHNKNTSMRTKKGYQMGVVIAVPPFPFEDYKAFKKYSEDATILFKKPKMDGVHIGEVKLVEGDWHLAGRSGYSLVVTSSGTTMEETIKQTYDRVRNIMIPNMFYRTDIGQRWFRDSDMLLSWGYL
jgi:phosphoribosylamine-glycine ligase/intein/homing endonuclease